MKFVVDVDPDLNRRLIAKRLGWPAGALAACTALAAANPAWSVYWSRGPVNQPERPGYRAHVEVHDERGRRRVELFAEDPVELAKQMGAVKLDPPDWPGPITPLVEPR